MTYIKGDWVSQPATQAIFDMLEQAGFEAFFVGGCVRDALAGVPVKDIDLSTDAKPDRVLALAKAAGLHAIPTGLDHGTVTVVSGDIPHEITTYRRDIETDGRRAVVAFADNIADDAMRRDFTMNALYSDRDGRVQDPTGFGLDDLEHGIVRFVGDAETRIREDFLRILRFFRFQSRFGHGGPDPDALAAIANNLDGLDTLSAERIGAEIRALLSLEDPAPAVATMATVGILSRILPGAAPTTLAPLIHFEQEAGMTPDPLRRLAALGGEDVTKRLRLSRADARILKDLLDGVSSGQGPGELGYRNGARTSLDILLLRSALFGTSPTDADMAEAVTGASAVFPVSASDLSNRFEGKALGDALRLREDRWIASGFSLSREDLLPD